MRIHFVLRRNKRWKNDDTTSVVKDPIYVPEVSSLEIHLLFSARTIYLVPICNVKLFYFPQLTLRIISAYMDITSEETVVSVYMCIQSLSHVQLFCDLMDCNPPGSSVYYLTPGVSPTQGWTCISCTSCIGRWILYHCVTWESQKNR